MSYEKLHDKSEYICKNEIINSSDCQVVDDEKSCECIICFNNFKWYQTRARCKLCNNECHYSCYKKFTKRNIFYANKCIHCRTRTIEYIKPWWMCCLYL